MRTIALIARKGGGGKSTLCAHLAVESSQRNRTTIVDIDPQGSLADWWNQRTAAEPSFAMVDVDQLRQQTLALEREGIETLFIDTPPHQDESTEQVVKVSNLVVVPVRPSPLDLRAIGPTVALIARLKTPFVFVLNGGTPCARLNDEAVAILKKHGPLAIARIHNRVDFPGAMVDGRTAGELNSTSKAALEVSMLWKYVDKQLRKGA